MITQKQITDPDDAQDILLRNGMFRNRDYNGIPISGSDAEYRSFELAETTLHNENLIAAIEQEQMTMIREAFPEGW